MSTEDQQPAAGEPDDPLSELLRAMFQLGSGTGGEVELPPQLAGIPGMPTDPAALRAMVAQVQRVLADGETGPVHWQTAHDVARQAAVEGGDPSVGERETRQVTEALRTADLWLDRVCELSATTGRTHAWSRAEWIEHTLPTWQVVVEPVAASVAAAMTGAVASQAPPEFAALLAGAAPMMQRMSGAFFGLQLGQAIGALAREVVGGADTGLPLLADGSTALVPVNVTAFGEGLDLPLDEVRLYLALREAAHARLLGGVGWLRAHLLGTVEDYARGISIDGDKIEAAVREVDPSDPEALQRAMAGGLFDPERTPAQQAALDRLETALGLVEGWVDEVVDAAARGNLPHAAALRETVRRRRAAGGPAEHTFASLVGLELRPRRLREAAAVWAALAQARGIAGRDALWAHPDLLPTADAFTDPAGFARSEPGAGGPGDAMDAALTRLLDEGADGGGGAEGGE
jgi:putative hydrolase